jgi:hypothetical protein
MLFTPLAPMHHLKTGSERRHFRISDVWCVTSSEVGSGFAFASSSTALSRSESREAKTAPGGNKAERASECAPLL